MKKLILTTAAFALLSAGVMAQQKINPGTPVNLNLNEPAAPVVKSRGCGTGVPSAEWDKEFNKAVEQWKAEHVDPKTGRITSINHYTVAVIMHVIHGGQAVGTYPNLSYAQLKSQVDVLNADYAGIGNATSTYTALTSGGHGPFYDYAQTNSLPSPDNTTAGILPQNTGITFCMATKDPSGATLAEAGVERINYTSTLVGPNQTHVYPITHYTTSTYPSGNPASTTYSTSTNFPGFIDNVIKPNTIWPVSKYLNIWVTDEESTTSGGGPGLLGYATFPGGTGLSGLSAPYGSATTDGFWTVAYGCGNTATGAGWTSPAAVTKSTGSPTNTEYNMGRTCSHEIGHYFGLRHTWGDATCGTDYCNDTPPEQTSTFYGAGTGNTTMIYPYLTGTCSATGSYNSDGPDGIMYQNFMDYSDDKFMCLFTNDQVARIQTTMANGTNRNTLNAAASTECATSTSTVAPTAAFTYPASICANQAASFIDASTGGPTSWAWSVNPSTGVVITTSTSQNPTINFPAGGTYTVTLAATNTVGTNSTSHAITVTSCTTSTCDTVSNIGATDTLTLYKATTGYFAGKNNYGFTGLAEAYAQTQFPTGMQVKGGIIIFYRKSATIGTHGTGAVTLSMVNGTTPGATAAATKTFSLTSVASTAAVTHVDYSGNPGLAYSTAILVPYVATFATPVTLNSDFFLSLSVPTATADTIAVFSGRVNHNTANTAWVNYQSSWGDLNTLAGANYSFAMIPIACPATTTGIENNVLGSNINLFPNPNSGQFNFAVSLSEATNLNFTVVNTLGQVVYTKTENNVSNAVLSCDLSHLAKGIYYANIVDSNNNKTVKKIIIE